jgi:2-aminoadipate transaminase
LAQELKRIAKDYCTADEIPLTSGSLQALDLVKGILLARGDTLITEAETYQGSLNRWTRLCVNAVRIPLDSDRIVLSPRSAASGHLPPRL